MSETKLGPQPVPEADPPPPPPGGVDAQEPADEVLAPDPDPLKNPAVGDQPELRGQENTATAATRGEEAPENEDPA